MDVHFKIIIPFYNVEKYIKLCIRSIKAQSYKNFQCILMNDLSTDNSYDIAKKEIADDSRFKLINVEKRAYALKNIYDAINISEPKKEDVIVTVDGDDWLASRETLSIIKNYYEKYDCWITYGSYVEHPSNNIGKFSKQIPKSVIDNNLFRESPWLSSHLRSFKYHLWERINKDDLLDQDNNFYKMAWDLAFMLPMLEMSGSKSKYIKEILYVYNLGNPLNDHKIDNTYQVKLEQQIRNKTKYIPLERQDLVDPKKFLTYNRFDLAAKIIFAKDIIRGINSDFSKEIYLKHLQVWNNFKEKNPLKTNQEDFIDSFKKVLNSMKSNGFLCDGNEIPVINNLAINGAHRISSAIVTNTRVKQKESNISEGQINCGYDYFKSKNDFVKGGLEEIYLDEMALEFCRQKKNLYTVCLFPSHNKSIDSLLEKIKNNSKIIYVKKVKLNNNGKNNFIHNLYHGESWLGSKNNNFPGVHEKSKYCFSQGDYVHVALIEQDNPNNLLLLKQNLRDICDVGKHSVHINDTQDETWRIASSVYNKNSVEFLNSKKTYGEISKTNTNTFDKLFKHYQTMILNRKDSNDFCVDASAVLSAFNLRDCRDLDFLHLYNIGDLSVDINCHNEEEKYYTQSRKDIITDPRNHFYYFGLKFASIKIIKDMKLKRNEEKDIIDVNLIKSIYEH